MTLETAMPPEVPRTLGRPENWARTCKGNRLRVRPKVSYWYQESADRLFVCHNGEQGAELQRLCGKAITCVHRQWVLVRKLTKPFTDLVDLQRPPA